MQLNTVELKFQVLHKTLDFGGVECPVRYDVSLFNDKSIYLAEVVNMPVGDVTLHSAVYHDWRKVEECFPDVAACITMACGNVPPRFPEIVNR